MDTETSSSCRTVEPRDRGQARWYDAPPNAPATLPRATTDRSLGCSAYVTKTKPLGNGHKVSTTAAQRSHFGQRDRRFAGRVLRLAHQQPRWPGSRAASGCAWARGRDPRRRDHLAIPQGASPRSRRSGEPASAQLLSTPGRSGRDVSRSGPAAHSRPRADVQYHPSTGRRRGAARLLARVYDGNHLRSVRDHRDGEPWIERRGFRSPFRLRPTRRELVATGAGGIVRRRGDLR